MFDRFTDRARRVVVLSRSEALLLNHSYIGTEHLLLGILAEGSSVAADALRSLDIELEDARDQIEQIIGRGETAETDPSALPFTPRTKKVLELSLKEAHLLGHNYIGTEHILLALAREGDGVAAQVLVKLGARHQELREAVIRLLSGQPASGRWPDMRSATYPPITGPRCHGCRRDLSETAVYRMQQLSDESEGELTVAVLFCNSCGSSLGFLP